jgi:sec-independent protein translocase protein TatC
VSLFALGGYIAYWTLDKALEFLISWSGEDVSQSYQITKYVSLVTLMVLAFGVGFLFPVLLVFMQLVNVITPGLLLKQWRWAVMSIFLTAAIITPSGDPISMLALAIPMTILYVISVGIGFFIQWRRKKANHE